MAEINELLRTIRGKDSLREAKRKTGLSHNYISILEKGIDPRTGSPMKPSPDTLKSYAEGYNYSYTKLLIAAGYITFEQLEEALQENSRKIIEEANKNLKDVESVIDGLYPSDQE